jgi:cell division protein FtsQ
MRNKKRNTTTRTVKVQSRPVKRRRTSVSSRKKGNSGNIFNVLVPLTFILLILFGLGFLFFKGYQTVTASSFFEVKRIDVRGTSRVSKTELEKIVRQQTERKGVWNADLEQIKAEIEKNNFVKTAVVSRLLPDGIRVQVEERVQRAVVRLNGRDFWADDEAVDLGAVTKNENRPPFVLRGWDETKSEKAQKDNQERVKIYLKMQEEWQNLGLAKRVIVLNLSDLQNAQATVEDSGETVILSLGIADFGKRLQRGLTLLEGKGQNIESLDLRGGNVTPTYRNS